MNRLNELDRRNVTRLDERLPKGGVPVELFLEVRGFPFSRFAIFVNDRGIHDDRRRREPSLKCRRIDDGLERRPGLPDRLDRAVEFGLSEVVTALHRKHVSSLRLHRKQGPLDLRLLIKRHGDVLLANLDHPDEDEVSFGENSRRKRRISSGGRRIFFVLDRLCPEHLLKRKLRRHRSDHDRSILFLVVHRRYDGLINGI